MRLALLSLTGLFVVALASGAEARQSFAREPSYADFAPAVSPDGTRLAFLREGISASRQIRYQALYVSGRDGRGTISRTTRSGAWRSFISSRAAIACSAASSGSTADTSLAIRSAIDTPSS